MEYMNEDLHALIEFESFISQYKDDIINQDISPYCLFSEFTRYDIDCFKLNTWEYPQLPLGITNEINTILRSRHFYSENRDDLKNIGTKLFSHSSQLNGIDSRSSVFLNYSFIISSKIEELYNFYAKKIESSLKKMPIPTSKFPHYASDSSSSDQSDLNYINQILDRSTNQENTPILYKQSDLIQFYDILSKYPKPFSISPSIVLSYIDKITNFLRGLQTSSENQTVFEYFRNLNIESEEFKCYSLSLLILMRLYMMINRTPDFLTVLIELISFEENHPSLKIDDHFSYKNIVQQILPDSLTKRSFIIKNASIDSILDFCFNHDDENNFILTKEGVFKINDLNKSQIIEFNQLNKTQVDFGLIDFDKKESKITFSNGILYLICNNTIHRVSVSRDEEEILKEQKIKKKQDKSKEHSQIQHPPKKGPKTTKKKKSSKSSARKIEKKEKRNKRKMERYIIEERKINLESVNIDLPDFPVIAVGSYDNYIRIVQRKSSNDEKVSLILTNVDLIPNERINYDFEEIFTQSKEELKFIQTQAEFEISNKLNNIFFSNDYMFISYDNSLIEKWIIYRNGKVDILKHNISPFASFTNTIFKMDEKSFLYSLKHLKNDVDFGISISKLYLPETKYCMNEDEDIFLKYPFLHNLSNIINNCSQLILNRDKLVKPGKIKNLNGYYEEFVSFGLESNKKITKKEPQTKNSYILEVSPEEMGCIIQSTTQLASQLKNSFNSIANLKDEKLKRFFVSLFIKICGINLYYDMPRNFSEKIDVDTINSLNITKKIIIDLYSLSSNSVSNTLQESMIFTLSIGGMLLFLPDSYEELHNVMDKVLSTPNSHTIIKLLSSFIFSKPSSLYFINQTIYDILIKSDQEINLFSLFYYSIYFIMTAYQFAFSTNIENIKFINPYFEALFTYIKYILENKINSLAFAEYIISPLFGLGSYILERNPYFSLMIEKELIKINDQIYQKICEIPDAVKFDNDIIKYSKDIDNYEIQKEKYVIETKHPYNLEFLKEEPKEKIESEKKSGNEKKKTRKMKKKYIKIHIGTVEFKNDVDYVYVQCDKNNRISNADSIELSTGEYLLGYNINNKLIKLKNRQKIDVFIKRKIDQKDTELDVPDLLFPNNSPLWGVKYTFYGVSTKMHQYASNNNHCIFYQFFIQFLINHFYVGLNSLKVGNSEKDFNLILNEKIIQGIKSEDINNFEEQMSNETENDNNNQNKEKRTISRGISRGISFDYENQSPNYDDKMKKDFLNNIIKLNDNPKSQFKRFIDVIYDKTSKKNRIRLNENSKIILEGEYYLAACLFKHLGLISLSMEFMKIISVTKKDDLKNIEVPILISSIWKHIYALRKVLFFEYQKSKSVSNVDTNFEASKNNFKQYLEEIKSKCKLLLYSVPILQFKDNDVQNDDKFESAAKSIYSFITSKIPLSKISEFIDIRRKRLSISMEALSLIQSFLTQGSILPSLKSIICQSNKINFVELINNCEGVKYNELNEYKQLLRSFALTCFQKNLTDTSDLNMASVYCLENLINIIDDDQSKSECAKIIIDMIEKNENNNSFFHNNINIKLIVLLYGSALSSKDNNIIQFFFKYLNSDKIDFQSKQIILMVLPILATFIPDDKILHDETIAFSILEKNINSPIMVRSVFYWLAVIINSSNNNTSNHREFILKVFKGIGQSFFGKSCLFINDSFKSFTHKQVSQAMISFIIMLYNMKNELLLSIIHDILTKMICNINFEEVNEEMILSIGLFASLGLNLSAFEPDRSIIINDVYEKSLNIIRGYNSSLNIVNTHNSFYYSSGFYENSICLSDTNFNFSEQEIDNIIYLNDKIIHSKYFTDKPCYENSIDQKEIAESVLISTFYSFLCIFMQNKNNASILLNEDNLTKSLSLFEMANHQVPSNENSILFLSHYLEKAIFDPLYNYRPTNEIEILLDSSIRFVKMNFGEVIYSKEGSKNDIIKSDSNYINAFCCNRLFDSNNETYYEVKINKIGSKNIFIGFIDSEETSIEKIFGFGCLGSNNVFCRKSPYLNKRIVNVGDGIVIDEHVLAESNKLDINEGDIIGCYYTKYFIYLVINGILTPYRLSHKSLKSYVPIICIDKDEVELEIVQISSSIDHSNEKYEFLDISKLPENYFEQKDINTKIKQRRLFEFADETLTGEVFIGSYVKDIIDESVSYLEPFKYPKTLLKYQYCNGIVKDIIPLKENIFCHKAKITSYNMTTLSKEEIDIDVESRYFKYYQTNFFNIIENRTNTKFGLNTSYDIRFLPKHLQTGSNLNEIRKYMKNRTIKDNSKSIAIIMARYLTFILIDYLRYSKSKLLQDEGINSKEASCIIKSLAHSLPTITIFDPVFNKKANKKISTIFTDDINEQNSDNSKYQKIEFNYFTPECFETFDSLFESFLIQSEQFLSPIFISKLLQESFENANKYDSISCSSLYDFIPAKNKIESISPLPSKKFSFREKLMSSYFLQKNSERLQSGSVPILLSSIPENLPCAFYDERGFRISSEKVSYFKYYHDESSFKIKWSYKNENNNNNENKNYKLQFGIFNIKKKLEEFLLNSPLGFIQVLFKIFQFFVKSEYFFNKNQNLLNQTILGNIFTLSLQRNPLVFPFLKHFIILISSSSGFSDDLLTKKAAESFSILSGSLSNIFYPIKEYPSYKNELLLIFSLYYNLIETRNAELSMKNINHDGISSIFDKYYLVNNELFKIDDEKVISIFSEGAKEKKFMDKSTLILKKNYKMFYLLYYYSILLDNKNHLPYPQFLFINDRLRQHFGGFRFAISRGDIINFKERNSNNNDHDNKIYFKSDVLNNNNDLECSCVLFNIMEKENKNCVVKLSKLRRLIYNKYKNDNPQQPKEDENISNKNTKIFKVIAHQLNDDKRIEIPQTGEKINVSFPLEIVVYKEEESEKEKIEVGEAFILSFSPSKEKQFDFFINHYDELQNEFKQFLSLAEYDDQLSGFIFKPTESNSEEEDFNDLNENEEQIQENPPLEDMLHARFLYDNFLFDDNLFSRKKQNPKIKRKDFELYELTKIPTKVPAQFPLLNINENIISLRFSLLTTYNNLAEKIMIYYSKSDQKHDFRDNSWSISLPYSSSSLQDLYDQQIIRPVYAMSTKLKFNFINRILMNEKKGEPKIRLVINRFEQQRFMDQFDPKSHNSASTKARPMIVQLMEQVDENSLYLLKVHRKNPFTINLVGEGAIDSSGPGREIFSSLIVELMNDHIGIFTYNPNRRHKTKDTNQEDLIPNKIYKGNIYDNVLNKYYGSSLTRFIYAGALIAICLVSDLPQQMKLAPFIWEYLSQETVSIESIYTIDNEFKEIMKNAESLQQQIIKSPSSMSEEEFESKFMGTFEIKNSFDEVVQLVDSGDKKRVTKENLGKFIELAKSSRIHEFDSFLLQLKKGFDMIMSYKNISSILTPSELKLLICGEPNCSVEQMKEQTVVQSPDESHINMFWNVMESFSVEERILFIKFSTGSQGLPAPGLKWEDDLKIFIKSKEDLMRDGKVLPEAHTCFSEIYIPYFESEEELAKKLRIAINHGGMISDSDRIPEGIEQLI